MAGSRKKSASSSLPQVLDVSTATGLGYGRCLHVARYRFVAFRTPETESDHIVWDESGFIALLLLERGNQSRVPEHHLLAAEILT